MSPPITSIFLSSVLAATPTTPEEAKADDIEGALLKTTEGDGTLTLDEWNNFIPTLQPSWKTGGLKGLSWFLKRTSDDNRWTIDSPVLERLSSLERFGVDREVVQRIINNQNNPWFVLGDPTMEAAVWHAPDKLRKAYGVDYIKAGPATNSRNFSQFEVYNTKGQRMAHVLVENQFENGGFRIWVDPTITETVHSKSTPALSQIAAKFAKATSDCGDVTASFAGGYSCATEGNPQCVGPTLLYDQQDQRHYGPDGLVIINGRKHGEFNKKYGGIVIFYQSSGSWSIYSSNEVCLNSDCYNLNNADGPTGRNAFIAALTKDPNLSVFQSFRLVTSSPATAGALVEKEGTPIGIASTTDVTTRRVLANIRPGVLGMSAVVTLEFPADMKKGGEFIHDVLGAYEAVTLDTGDWSPMLVNLKEGPPQVVLPLQREVSHYVMTIHACSPTK
ncbi:MAG: hypothetical protein Q7S98_04295 [Deltaproteobacteria bacterium]|nr:hypothetical protein [Deltaproteobacteria bacterium]